MQALADSYKDLQATSTACMGCCMFVGSTASHLLLLLFQGSCLLTCLLDIQCHLLTEKDGGRVRRGGEDGGKGGREGRGGRNNKYKFAEVKN